MYLIVSVCLSVCPSTLSRPNRLTFDLHAENQGRRLNGSAMRGRTDERYQVHYLPRVVVNKHMMVEVITITAAVGSSIKR